MTVTVLGRVECAGPDCSETFPPKGEKRFCCNRCRVAAWHLDNPKVSRETFEAFQRDSRRLNAPSGATRRRSGNQTAAYFNRVVRVLEEILSDDELKGAVAILFDELPPAARRHLEERAA